MSGSQPEDRGSTPLRGIRNPRFSAGFFMRRNNCSRNCSRNNPGEIDLIECGVAARTEVDDYVRHLVISECFGDDGNPYVVGKLAMDQILWNDALADGVVFRLLQ